MQQVTDDSFNVKHFAQLGKCIGHINATPERCLCQTLLQIHFLIGIF